MNKNMNNKIIVIVAGFVVVCLLSGLAGYWLGAESTKAVNKKITDTLSLLGTSTVVPTVNAFGRVTDISGRNITLSYGGKNTLTVFFGQDARIYEYTLSARAADGSQQISKQEEVKFENIKLNETLNVSIKVLGTGQVQAIAAHILPAQ